MTPPTRVSNIPAPRRGAKHVTDARFWTVWLVLTTAAVVYLQIR